MKDVWTPTGQVIRLIVRQGTAIPQEGGFVLVQHGLDPTYGLSHFNHILYLYRSVITSNHYLVLLLNVGII